MKFMLKENEFFRYSHEKNFNTEIITYSYKLKFRTIKFIPLSVHFNIKKFIKN